MSAFQELELDQDEQEQRWGRSRDFLRGFPELAPPGSCQTCGFVFVAPSARCPNCEASRAAREAGPDGKCPNGRLNKPSCKRRDCPACGPRWARDWYRNLRVNLESVGCPVVTICVTAPGIELLPWDDDYCRRRGRTENHRHSGKGGCRVQARALREWCSTLQYRWVKLRAAALQATKSELVFKPPLVTLARVWEPQKRGAPHVHLVLPFGTKLEQIVAWTYLEQLRRLAPGYGFGEVQRRKSGPDLQAIEGSEAARYLASYLTGRTARKGSIRENIADPRMPRGLVWVSPKLTRLTMVTMRTLRRSRHLWAADEGICELPIFGTYEEAVRVAITFRRIYPSRHGPVGGDVDDADLLRWAQQIDRYELERGLKPYFWEEKKLRDRSRAIVVWALQETGGRETKADLEAAA